jgi:hypothetical protein
VRGRPAFVFVRPPGRFVMHLSMHLPYLASM